MAEQTRSMNEKTKLGYFAKKIVEQMRPPTAPDSNGKNIMSRREAILVSAFIALIPVIGGGYIIYERQARAGEDLDKLEVTMVRELDEKADEDLINQKFITVQNQLNNIESGVNDNKDSIKEIENDIDDIKESSQATYTAVQVLLERSEPR